MPWLSLGKAFLRRRETQAKAAAAPANAAREERERGRREALRAWRAHGASDPAGIAAFYEERRAALDPELASWARPVAAWALRAGQPSATGSHMGGPPGMERGEPWPTAGGQPMRFWAQLNLAHLVPFARAFEVEMPGDGLLQLFAADDGGERARYLPESDLAGLELRDEIPFSYHWEGVPDVASYVGRSLLIDLYPEALVPWSETADIIHRDGLEHPLPCTTSEDLPGYSFGWWPMSDWWATAMRERSADAPPADAWTFLAVCAANRDLGLSYSDEGFLWAMLPTADLAARDFSRLVCQGESS